MKKILICGAAGFIMSNFVRYVLYKYKEFEIISIDMLKNDSDFNKLYVHRKHNFYVGNVCDYEFVNKIIKLHNPDIIINSTDCNSNDIMGKADLIKGSAVLTSFNKPLIQLLSSPTNYDCGIWNCIEKIVDKSGIGTCIEFSNCFGRRQDRNSGLGYIIYNIINNSLLVSRQMLPWIFVEDLIDIIISTINDDNKEKIEISPLGFSSALEVSKMVCEFFDKDYKTLKQSDNLWDSAYINYDYKNTCINEDLKQKMIEVIGWYRANNWAISI